MAENIGIGARLRATVARILAAIASLFHGAERWSQGGVWGILALVLVTLLAVVSIIEVAREARATGSWASTQLLGTSPHAKSQAAKSNGEPVAKPAAKPVGKPIGKPEGPGRGAEGVPAPPPPPS